ncbi:MAG: hypothetical protein DMG96_21220 [Acidobacteria bacterium]|nr:MAG: hypothetical protein DMG96_21220 [Acidobacteriota bacterium]
MKNLSLIAALALFAGHTTSAQIADRLHTAPRPSKSTLVSHYLRRSQLRRSTPSHDQQALRRATAASDVNWVDCFPEAQDLGAMCGTLPVPLDRRYPTEKKINIYFELYLHTNPGLAESAILANDGGPGGTTTGLRDGALFLFGQNLDAHDLLAPPSLPATTFIAAPCRAVLIQGSMLRWNCYAVYRQRGSGRADVLLCDDGG